MIAVVVPESDLLGSLEYLHVWILLITLGVLTVAILRAVAVATGHGIGPALSVIQVRAMLRMAVRIGKDLSSIAHHMNEQLCADLHAGRFITAWLGKLDATKRTLTSFSAGQAPLIRYDAARDEFETLKADTQPFGIISNINVAVADPFDMNPGDIFAVISDGIFEAADRMGKQFGTERTIEVISTHLHSSPTQILTALKEAVADFTKGTPAADDRTAIIIKRTGR